MSFRLLLKVVALVSTGWLSVSQALAENRIALVIGNSSYKSVPALPNPANDAKAMTRFLASAGFQVLQAPDLTQSDMRRTIGNFASIVAEKGPETVALVFYAGHGLQVDGENYLVPVDASIQREADVPLQATRLADLMNALAAVPSKTKLIIVDACRNNPYSEINKTTGRGLAIVDAPTGSLVSYSTAPGTEALDGDGANSPYTAALIKVAAEPGLPIEQALKRVRLAVTEATGQQQIPWESSSLTNEFAFFQSPNRQPRTQAASAGQPNDGVARTETRSVESWQKELKARTPKEAYETVIREDKVEAYQAYLALYPNQSNATVVRSIVERRQVMVAWHEAVTINTTASYQAFLASYGNSDFVLTANRLVDRIRTRSVSNPTAAFASVAPTCPCSQPNNPTPTRTRRTDNAPAGNNGPTTSVASVTPVVVPGNVVTPAPVYEDPPVRVRIPDSWPPGRVRVPDWPRHDGGKPPHVGDGGYPKGDGKPPYPKGDGRPPYPKGDGYPKGDSYPKGDVKPTRSVGGNYPMKPVKVVTPVKPMKTVTPYKPMRTITTYKPRIAGSGRPVMMNRSMSYGRPMMMNRSVGMGRSMGTGPRPMFRMGGFGGRRFF